MADKKKKAISVTLLFAIVGVGLIVTAFSTDHWIESSPIPNKENKSEVHNLTGGGSVNFGLFSGHSALQYGLGVRPINLKGK